MHSFLLLMKASHFCIFCLLLLSAVAVFVCPLELLLLLALSL